MEINETTEFDHIYQVCVCVCWFELDFNQTNRGGGCYRYSKHTCWIDVHVETLLCPNIKCMMRVMVGWVKYVCLTRSERTQSRHSNATLSHIYTYGHPYVRGHLLNAVSSSCILLCRHLCSNTFAYN